MSLGLLSKTVMSAWALVPQAADPALRDARLCVSRRPAQINSLGVVPQRCSAPGESAAGFSLACEFGCFVHAPCPSSGLLGVLVTGKRHGTWGTGGAAAPALGFARSGTVVCFLVAVKSSAVKLCGWHMQTLVCRLKKEYFASLCNCVSSDTI